MKRRLILGLGGSGSRAAEMFCESYNREDEVSFLALDCDIEALEKIEGIPTVCMTDYSSLGRVIDKLKAETVSEWFPCGDNDEKVTFFKSLEMGKGANGWRMKGLLSFENR